MFYIYILYSQNFDKFFLAGANRYFSGRLEQRKILEPPYVHEPRSIFDHLSLVFSDNKLCLGCGPLSIGTAAVIGSVRWSKQRHICQNSEGTSVQGV